MPLKRSLGLTMLTFYGTGMILGAGIYSIIGQAAGIAGYGLWQGFMVAATAAVLTALSYAEMATMYPKAGGAYVYLKNAFSERRWIAGMIGNVITFAGCASATTVALAFASYLQYFVPLPSIWVASSLLVFFTCINVVGIQQSSWVNAAFTVIEIFGLILFIWLGWQNPKFGDALLSIPTSATISSAALIIFAYFGFENIVNLAEETQKPEKIIPRAIFLSLSVSTLLYVLVSLAAVALMPPEQLANTESALSAAAKGSSPSIARVLGVIALFSTANTALIALLTSSRIIYGISSDNSLPKIFSKILKFNHTPWVAALTALTLSMALLPLQKIETLASVTALTTMIAFIGVNLALIVLRIKQPELNRPFRVPLAFKQIPVLPVLAILSCLIFILQFDQKVYFVSLGALVGSACLYFIHSYFKRKA